jgi:signal transduction histidine kinase
MIDILQQALADGQPRRETLPDPQTGQPVEVRVYPTAGGLSVYFRDLTEQTQQQDAMQMALDAAEAGLRSRTRFLATMSHELRTPLQTILGYADLLVSDSGQPLSPSQREDVDTIRRAATHMAALIDDLLTLSQENEEVTTTLTADELRRVIEQVRQEMAPHASAKSVALDVDLPGWLPGVRADLMRVHRILRNLVGNAIKFTDVGKITINACVTETEFALTVRDTGIGISAEALPQVFDPFYQGESAMNRRYEGAGLGLSIARRFAEQMGGRITVTSTPGMGSAFTLHLPFARVDDRNQHSG